MLTIKLKVKKAAPSKLWKFDLKAHKKRLIELRPRRIKPAGYDGHGNIRFTMD